MTLKPTKTRSPLFGGNSDMKKQKRGIKVEPDYKSMKLVCGGIIAVIVMLIVSFLTGGCTTAQRQSIIDLIPTATPEPEVTATPEPQPTATPPKDGKYSTEGSQRLLVKPASDNTGNL